MKLKKLLVGALSAAMIFSSASFAFADSVDLGGSGEVEGVVSEDVVEIDLPTVADGSTIYDFILDPQGLIAKTQGDRYTGSTFEAGKTLYFKQQDNNYYSKSDVLTAKNKGTTDLDVTVEATVSGAEAVTFTDDETFANDTDPSVYLAVKEVSATEASPIQDGKAELKGKIDKNDIDTAYELKWDAATGKYKYELKSSYTDFEEYSFQLEGACNANADWTGKEDIAPEVKVVWTVEEASKDKAPSFPTKSYKMTAGKSIAIDVDWGTGSKAATDITSVKNSTASGDFALTKGTDWRVDTVDGQKILRIVSAKIDAFINSKAGKTLKVTFNDASGTEETVNLTL